VKLNDRRDRAMRRYHDSLPLRVSRRMIMIGGYDRALALSAQAFVALVPLLVVVSAVAPAALQGPAGRAILAGFGLSAAAASALSDLVDHPPGADTLSVLGVVLLVLAVLGFTRSLQRTYVMAWRLPARGIRGLGYGLLAAVALISEFALLTLLGPVATALVGYRSAGIAVQAVGATLLWWPVQYLLLGGRVGWRALLPGAALTGIGQAVVILVSGVYLPIAIGHQADRYGLVGVAIALLSWLVVLGLLLVVSAVVSAEVASGPLAADERDD